MVKTSCSGHRWLKTKDFFVFMFRYKSAWYSFCSFVLLHVSSTRNKCHICRVFLLVFTPGLSTSIVENLYENLSLTLNLKFDLISQSGWIVFQANHNTALKAVTHMACLTFLTIRLPISWFSGKYHDGGLKTEMFTVAES